MKVHNRTEKKNIWLKEIIKPQLSFYIKMHLSRWPKSYSEHRFLVIETVRCTAFVQSIWILILQQEVKNEAYDAMKHS